MAFWQAIKSAAVGNFEEASGFLFEDADAIAVNEQVKLSQQKLLNERLVDGRISDEKYNELMGEVNATGVDLYKKLNVDPEFSPAVGFGEGLAEGLENEKKASRGLFNFLGKTLFGLLPVWLWLLLGLGLVVYLVSVFNPKLFKKLIPKTA